MTEERSRGMRRWIGLVVVLAAGLTAGWMFWLRPDRDRLVVPTVRLVETPSADAFARGAAPPRVSVGDDTRPVLALKEQRGTFTHQTGAFMIAEHSTLAFAIGVATTANQHGAIKFEVDTCTDAGCEPFFNTRIDLGTPAASTWVEQRIPLPTFGGAPRMLRFRAIADPPGPRPLWADPTIFAPASRPPGGRNLILLSLDTLRADHLGSYGYPRDTSPFIDQTFARRRGATTGGCAQGRNSWCCASLHSGGRVRLRERCDGCVGVVLGRRAPRVCAARIRRGE